MAVEFRCAQCDKLLRIGDDAAGRQAKCPECGAISPVPSVEVGPSSSEAGSPFAPGSPGQAAGGQPREAHPAPGQYGRQSQKPYGPPVSGEVPNYLVQAILCTVFCCQVFGIVAIVFAAQVNGKLSSGDYQGAVSCSNSARTWCWVAFWLGLLFYVVPCLIWMLFLFGAVAAGM